MSQIINLNIGKAGIRIGQKFLDKISNEHFQNQQQPRGKYEIFFQQNEKKYTSRSLFLDIDPRTIQNIKPNKKNYSIKQSNLLKGTGLYSDLFSTGCYLQGALIIPQAIQIIRKQVQKCDRLNGFLINNSIGGGTGSGMTALLLTKLREQYCPYIVQQHLILPQTQIFYSPLQIYNSVLSLQNFVQQTDICFIAENQAFLQRLLFQNQLRPNLNDLNNVHSQNIVEITSSYRFGGNLNTNPRKICTNLILFPRMKFIVSSFSSKNQKIDHLSNTFKQLNLSKSRFFQQSTGFYDIYTMQVNCRDNFMMQNQINLKVKTWMTGLKLNFSDFLPHSIHTSLIQTKKDGTSSNCMINSKYISKTFQKWAQLFSKNFAKQSFLHSYMAGGMDKMQFVEAQSCLNDLISQYSTSFLYADQDQYDSQNIEQ